MEMKMEMIDEALEYITVCAFCVVSLFLAFIMANTHRPPVAPRIAAQLAPRYAPPKLAAARKVAAAGQRRRKQAVPSRMAGKPAKTGALREIRHYQNTTGFVIPRAAFRRLVRVCLLAPTCRKIIGAN